MFISEDNVSCHETQTYQKEQTNFSLRKVNETRHQFEENVGIVEVFKTVKYVFVIIIK